MPRPPVDVAAGKLLSGVGVHKLPVVLVVIVGSESGTIERMVDEVARLQVMTAGFRPVFVTDVPMFSVMRRYGYPAEFLIPASQWDAAEQTWDEYARRVIAIMFEGYRATGSVTLGSAGLDAAGRAVLGSLRPREQD